MKGSLGIATLLSLALLAGACAPPRFASPPGTYAYRQGWHDGCSNGYAVAGSPLYRSAGTDEAPAAEGKAYEAGWQDGFLDCSSSYGRIQRTIHGIFAPS